MEEGHKASRGAYWREGSGMAVSLGRSEAKSFHAVSAVGRMGMVCGPGVFFRMAVLQLSWMMTPRWQGLRVTPRLRGRSLRPKAEIVRQKWAFCRSGAQVDTRLVPLSLTVTSFVVGCCGLLDSLWSGCVGLHSATTSSKVRVHQLLGTTTSAPHVHDCAAERVAPHTRRRLGEHAQTVHDQPKWCAFFLLRDAALSPSSRR